VVVTLAERESDVFLLPPDSAPSRRWNRTQNHGLHVLAGTLDQIGERGAGSGRWSGRTGRGGGWFARLGKVRLPRGRRRDRGDKPTCGEWHLRKVSWCFMLSKKDTTDSPSGDRIGQKAQSVPVSKNSHRMISGAAARGSAILPVVSWTRSNFCLDTSRSKRRNGTWAANRNYALPSTTERASNRTIHRLRSSVCV